MREIENEKNIVAFCDETEGQVFFNNVRHYLYLIS